MTQTIKVTGTRVTHTIHVCQINHWENFANQDASYRALRRSPLNYWKPENGAEFKTPAAARIWLTRLLKKPGWCAPQTWEIETNHVKGHLPSICIYNSTK